MSNEEIEEGGLGSMGRLWWGAGVVVVAIVAGLLYVLIAPGNPGDHTGAPRPTITTESDPPPSSSAARPSPAPWTASGEGGCNGTEPSETRPVAAPPGVTWEPLAGGSVPVSKQLGPRKVDGPLRRCFQRSPSGALLAASNMLQSAFTGTAAATRVFTEQMTPGSKRGQMLQEIADEPNEGSTAAEPAGFRLGACTPKACQVNIAFVHSGTYAQYKVSVVWVDGDWKLDGDQMIDDPATGTEPPAGYTVWGPAS